MNIISSYAGGNVQLFKLDVAVGEINRDLIP